MDRGSRIGTADLRAAGPAHSPRPHTGDERRKLPSETEQTQAGLPAELLIRPLPASTAGRHPPRQTRLGEEDVFRSGLYAPPFRRRRPPLQTPSSPTIPNLLHTPLVYLSSAPVVYFYSALDREDDDFNIRRPEDVVQAQLATSRIMTILLASVASLSLLVGGIGIMNIMLVSVTQRTREIGLRLAVGATESDVQLQFLSEAIVLSLLGGLLGLLGGFFSSTLVESLFQMPTKLSYEIFAIGGLFSAAIGILFGFYPARKASQLDPIQGLRFE